MTVKQTNIHKFESIDKRDADFKDPIHNAQTIDKICRVYPDENRPEKIVMGPLIQFGNFKEQRATGSQDSILYQLKSKTKSNSQGKFHNASIFKQGNAFVSNEPRELNTTSNSSLPEENKSAIMEDYKYDLHIKIEEIEEFEEGEVRKFL